MTTPPSSSRAARRPGRRLVAALVAALAVVAVSCSHDGRELARPDPDLTATSPPTTLAPTTLGAFLSIKSPAFDINGAIPSRYTCDGADVSPPLAFEGIPTSANSLVVTLTDADKDDFVHWVVTGIDPHVASFAAGQVPAGATVYPNDFGDAEYGGPCPPAGETHSYVFTVYSLPASAVQFVPPDQTNGAAIIEAVSGLATASAGLTATYTRQG